MRKVVVKFKDLEYKVDSDDVDGIIKDFRLDGPLGKSSRASMAALGLMYIAELSLSGGGAGDITDMEMFLTEHQKQLLVPAYEVIAQYYRPQNSKRRQF